MQLTLVVATESRIDPVDYSIGPRDSHMADRAAPPAASAQTTGTAWTIHTVPVGSTYR